MVGYSCERLSARDNLFLVAETAATPMHIAAVQILEAGSLRTPDGGIEVGRIERALEGVLHLVPRYRQKLAFPVVGRPVWVDDPHFDLGYHVRHARLPQPGTLAQLKCEASRIMELPLDRRRPLWELWVVEGVSASEQFALVSKMHHCMLDGAAGAGLASVLASPDPDAEVGASEPYHPRPWPSSIELLRDAWVEGAMTPLRFARRLASPAARAVLARGSAGRIGALRALAEHVLHGVSHTPLNGRPGPHRHVDWLSMSLAEVREVKKALSCTVNDLILATVAGALRSYSIRHSVDPSLLDFRVATPVNVRTELERGRLGNFVSSWIVPLPVGERSAAGRLASVSRATLELEQRRAELGVDTLLSLSGWLPEAVVAWGARAAARAANLIVTNVRGPQFPLYQLGSKLLGIHPLAPCLPGSGLTVAVFSYDGRLCWGLNADPELLPDLAAFTRMLDSSYRELADLAQGSRGPSLRPEAQEAAFAAGS